MDRNNTQTILLPNQPIISNLQQNNRQPILIQKQPPLTQIQQNNLKPGILPGQLPLVNSPQNNYKQIIISNQRPLIQPQQNHMQTANMPIQSPLVKPKLNNIQPGTVLNQKPLVHPQLNTIKAANIPNQTPLALQQQNNLQQANKLIQPTNNSNFKTETDVNLIETDYFQSIIKELMESEYAEIEYSRGLNMRKVFKSIYNFHDGEIFDIYLGKGEYKKNSFRCFEMSTSFQRYCVGTSKRQFDLDLYYNISDEEPQFMNDPILKIHRIEGGCCSDRGIMTVNYPKDNKLVGVIIQAYLANIYDSNNQLLYRVKLTFDPESSNLLQKFLGFCCCCCVSKKGVIKKEKDYKTFWIKKLVEREEQIEGITIKNHVQEIVGKMENYPLKIIFPKDASPKEKILLIISRIFLLYMMNFSETLREKWYETCKDIASGIAEDALNAEDQGILGRINEVKGFHDKIVKVEGFLDTFEKAAINKNIVSLDN